jgi:hypothetical protein
MMAFPTHLQDREVFAQSGGFRRQRSQHRGSGLGRVSYCTGNCEGSGRPNNLAFVSHTQKLHTIDLDVISIAVG